MNETANITELDNSLDYLVVTGITIFSFILLGIVIDVYQRKRTKRYSQKEEKRRK